LSLLIAALATALILLLLDLLWLGRIARPLYARELAGYLRAKPGWPAALLFYLLYLAGLLYFAVWPALAAGDAWLAVRDGFLIGLLAYGTYNLTNLATLKDWPHRIALIDWTWGACMSAVAAGGGALAGLQIVP